MTASLFTEEAREGLLDALKRAVRPTLPKPAPRPVDPPAPAVERQPRVSPPIASRHGELVREMHQKFGLPVDQQFSYELLRGFGDHLKEDMKRASQNPRPATAGARSLRDDRDRSP
jgi:hypothetical protein